MGADSKLAARTPAKTPATSKKANSASTGKQQSILGFFSKPAASAGAKPSAATSQEADSSPCLKETTKSNAKRPPTTLTPVPSSDPVDPHSSQENRDAAAVKVVDQSLPSPLTPAEIALKQSATVATMNSSSPIRKVRTDIFSTT
jgi:DNA mismatch repair protein MSH6